jgi:MYXO-CTERM domain-containing protein
VDAGAPADATGLVISQVYGAGGNSSATYTNDFVEIFNRGSAAISLAGLSVQYASSTGNFNTNSTTALPGATVQPGHYFLLQLGSSGAVGVALPTPDATNNGVNLSASNGKIALAYGTTALGCGGAGDAGVVCPASSLVDLVGYGAGASAFEGSGSAAAPGNSASSVQRLGGGCVDTDDNAADFAKPEPAVSPRNSASPFNDCAAGGVDAGGPGTPDGGSGGVDAGTRMDAGGTGSDAGLRLDAGPHDASFTGVPPRDGGDTTNGDNGQGSAGCSCRTAGADPARGPASTLGILGAAMALAAAAARRRRRGRAAR